MKTNGKKATAALMTMCTMMAGFGAAQVVQAASPLDASSPVTITVWNYYNGDQLAAFENLVTEFNDTTGAEEGIIVVSVSQGSIDTLAESLMDSVNGKAGSADVPSLVSVYGETAYILNQKEMLVNVEDYFTEEELASYVPDFLEEGRLVENGELLEFPVAKSTECFAVNATDWKEFADATGITPESITCIEDLTDAAAKYYEWTDGLTPDVAEDGKALYGRDSMANYIYIGTKQLGKEMFTVTADGVTVNMDKDVFRKLWDNYYIPYINGYFTASAKYRSEDMKIGKILALTGSTSGVSYLPTTVTDENDDSHDIEIQVLLPLIFKDAAEDVSVQQGADYCIMKTDEKQEYASAEFLKWFTNPQRNLTFAVMSGYSPVTEEANQPEMIQKTVEDGTAVVKNQSMLDALLVSSDVYLKHGAYTCKPFEGSKEIRDIFSSTLSTISEADRAVVEEQIAAGKTREEATAEFMTDEYFETWFNGLCDSVNAIVK